MKEKLNLQIQILTKEKGKPKPLAAAGKDVLVDLQRTRLQELAMDLGPEIEELCYELILGLRNRLTEAKKSKETVGVILTLYNELVNGKLVFKHVIRKDLGNGNNVLSVVFNDPSKSRSS